MNIYILDWTEYESGWGCRPDGLQLFTSFDEMNKVLERDKNERNSAKSTPSCYSIPTTKYICEVNDIDIKEMTKENTTTWFAEAGKRDMGYLKKTYTSLKVLATENL